MISKIRIASGIVLFVFVLGHLTNLAFGLISVRAMDAARPILMGIWSNPIGGNILLAAFLAHAGLGLFTLYRRNTLLMNWRDGSQALLGLAIVPLLLPHVMGVGVGPAISGMQPTYEWVLAVYWLFAPGLGIQQVLALIVIWVHGCYGLLLWLQVQERAGWTVGLIWPLVVVVPTSALLGFVKAGQYMHFNRNNDAIMGPVREQSALYQPYAEQLWSIHDTVLWIYAAIVLAVLAARLFRIKRSEADVVLHYDRNPTTRRPAGLSFLEMARAENIPHAALCGARGRCGSCAIRVVEGSERISPIGDQEANSLARTSQGDGVRLACQAMPAGGEFRVERIYDPRILPTEYRTVLRQGPPERSETNPSLSGLVEVTDSTQPAPLQPEPMQPEPAQPEPLPENKAGAPT